MPLHPAQGFSLVGPGEQPWQGPPPPQGTEKPDVQFQLQPLRCHNLHATPSGLSKEQLEHQCHSTPFLQCHLCLRQHPGHLPAGHPLLPLPAPVCPLSTPRSQKPSAHLPPSGSQTLFANLGIAVLLGSVAK
ncbi:unnamed protein product [Pipistrellus nathusii]|uniref:Uncharacterized protein n=1 Tax=Pipistrellus nathusii TaxID=59473 RepID=A0ABN9ZAF6_PIPNA